MSEGDPQPSQSGWPGRVSMTPWMWERSANPIPPGSVHIPLSLDMTRNEPFGSRPEPGILVFAPILLLPHGEVPEGRARGVQDTATRVRSESEG